MVNSSRPFPNLPMFEHKTSGFHTPHVFIHFYRNIHAVIIPGFSCFHPLGNDDPGADKTPSASSYVLLVVTVLQHSTRRDLLLSALLRSFHQLRILFPDKKELEPSCVEFRRCNNPFRNPFRLSHPSFTWMLWTSHYK